MKKCITCKITKELKSFSKRSINKDGYDNKCKICHSHYHRNRKLETELKHEVQKIDSSFFDLRGVTKKEWCESYRMLSKIGYNPELDIHTQFIQRHPELVLKRRPAKNVKYFTWEDCIKKTPLN